MRRPVDGATMELLQPSSSRPLPSLPRSLCSSAAATLSSPPSLLARRSARPGASSQLRSLLSSSTSFSFRRSQAGPHLSAFSAFPAGDRALKLLLRPSFDSRRKPAGPARSLLNDKEDRLDDRLDDRLAAIVGEHEPPVVHQLRDRSAAAVTSAKTGASEPGGSEAGSAVETAPPKLEVKSRMMEAADTVIPGTEQEVILQAFNWESHKSSSPSWWAHLTGLVEKLSSLGFTSLWLPPPQESLSPQGYIPQDLYRLDSAYGSDSELRSLLSRLKESNVGAIADLVVNHRAGSGQDEQGGWTRYLGIRPAWDERAVTSDTGGKGSPSTGTVFQGISNIDHTQEFVRTDLKAWMAWLKDDVGFASFRFDYAKGYSPDFVKEYLESLDPHLTVGEYWDDCKYVGEDYALDYDQDGHRQRIVDWIDGTGGKSAAFDFTTKAILQEAAKAKEWSRLRDSCGRAPGLLGFWPSRSVTFVDNHDTGSTQAHWPFPSEHILQGYAYILTHPGIPTVFYDHLFEWGQDKQDAIRDLLTARREGSVKCNSKLSILQADSESYVAQVGDRLTVQIGASDWTAPVTPDQEGSWKLVAKGSESSDYAVWILEGSLTGEDGAAKTAEEDA